MISRAKEENMKMQDEGGQQSGTGSRRFPSSLVSHQEDIVELAYSHRW